MRDCNPVDLWNYIYKMIDVKSGHEGNKRYCTVEKPGLIEMLQPGPNFAVVSEAWPRPACTRRKWRAISFLYCDFYFATKGEGVGQG